MMPGAEVSAAVAQTVHRLFHHLDSGEFEKLAGLFAVDGVWFRQGATLTGPDAVLAAMRQRPAALVTRHLVNNIIVDGDDEAVVATYHTLIFEHRGAEHPAPLALPHALFSNSDELVRAPDGWRFLSRRPSLIFKRP